jgi:hypothetical protein
MAVGIVNQGTNITVDNASQGTNVTVRTANQDASMTVGSVNQVASLALGYVRSDCTGTVIGVEGFDSLSQIYFDNMFRPLLGHLQIIQF